MSASKSYFVTGISTEVGKTIASAIVVQALQADYWKPIQSGDLHDTDSHKIQAYINNPITTIHPETFRLNTPASPHYSADVDGLDIHLDDFNLPKTDNHLIVEGAGGLLVPMNEKETILDLIIQLNIPVILVANFYLGSINHTLLSIQLLRQQKIKIKALVFMGNTNESSKDIITTMSKGMIEHYLEIPHLDNVHPIHIQAIAQQLKNQISQILL